MVRGNPGHMGPRGHTGPQVGHLGPQTLGHLGPQKTSGPQRKRHLGLHEKKTILYHVLLVVHVILIEYF